MTQIEPFKILRPVHYAELVEQPELLRLVEESMRTDPLSIQLEQLLDGIESRECVLWTWGEGVLITEVKDLPAGRVLYVTNVRGKGYIKHLTSIDADVTSYARVLGVKYMVGEVVSTGLAKEYSKRGAAVFHRVMREV